MRGPDGATEFVTEPDVGRVFSARRRVRLGDVTPGGRLRLDAVARYLQDIANDDAMDAALPGAMFWVVRRSMVEIVRPVQLREMVEVRTYCGGVGSRWAERRTRIIGADGGLIEAVSLWVSVDGDTGRPARLVPEFAELYGPAALGREVRARSVLNDPVPAEAPRRPWPLRATDLDVLDHVNNAVYWSSVEEELRRRRQGGRVRAELEFRSGIGPDDNVDIAVADSPVGGFDLWLLVDDEVRGAARVGYVSDELSS